MSNSPSNWSLEKREKWAQVIGSLQGTWHWQPQNYFELQLAAYLGDYYLDISVFPKCSWNVWLWLVFQLEMLQKQEDFCFHVSCCILPLLGRSSGLTVMYILPLCFRMDMSNLGWATATLTESPPQQTRPPPNTPCVVLLWTITGPSAGNRW